MLHYFSITKMKKGTLVMMYWIGVLLLVITLPSTKDVYIWQVTMSTYLVSGLIAITLPKAIKQYKELYRVVKLNREQYQEFLRMIRWYHNTYKYWLLRQDVAYNLFISFIFTCLLGILIGFTTIGIGIICIKCF